MRKIIVLGSIILALTSCNVKKLSKTANRNIVFLDTLEVPAFKPDITYKPSRTLHFDIVHTKLDIKPNIKTQQIKGKATLTIAAIYKSLTEIVLDAKGMDIYSVLLNADSINFSNTGKQLIISLPNKIQQADTFLLEINYLAKPNEYADNIGGKAIMANKGFYFINPHETEQKPTQFWTQGEPESNSVWFPTIDAPNERFSQEVALTIPENWKSLSNGEFQYATLNGDGTKTDFWFQKLTHAPYLVMVAAGNFEVVTEPYQNLQISYFVDPPFKNHASAIFKYTPQMIEFFSNKLNYPFPWDKYAQIVVRDYVSGAMENTGAVVFGEFVQKTTRELIDDDNQNIVAHELIHHWFGDLVTCESWANLPLNESFATYGPYLWHEYKWGLAEAQYYLNNNLQQYLNEAIWKQENLIRYYHDNPDDMFDNHSYAKGSLILHHLRKVLGDEHFFAGISKYLHDNAFKPVEVHNLRLAFEAVSGSDLNWFFNQWFLGKGHPVVEINYGFDDVTNKQYVFFSQKQAEKGLPVFTFPVDIELLVDGKKQTHTFWVKNIEDTFAITVLQKPNYVLVDPEGLMLWQKTNNRPYSWFKPTFLHSNSYLSRVDVLQELSKNLTTDTAAQTIMVLALTDRNWPVVEFALKHIKNTLPNNQTNSYQALQMLAKVHQKSQIRASALHHLAKFFPISQQLNLFQEKLADSSYQVIGVALYGILKHDKNAGLVLTDDLEKDTIPTMQLKLAEIYAELGISEKNSFFDSRVNFFKGSNKSLFYGSWINFLKNTSNQTYILQALPTLEHLYVNEPNWWIRFSLLDQISRLYEFINYMETPNLTNHQKTNIAEQINLCYNRLLQNETHPQIKQVFR